MTSPLKDRDWTLLLRRIQRGKCTPFIGAGACYGVLPLGAEVAREWARKYDYPMADTEDLVKVAQFLAVQHDAMFPKELILDRLKECGQPDFSDPLEPHALLADLPLPVYLTTNYDKFMVDALRHRNREPRRELCSWNRYIDQRPSVFDAESDYEPSPANPVVFHLHGHDEVPESLVLTEDDYLDFLVNHTRERQLLPARIEGALANASLIFIGYSLTDWTFRVLYRGLVAAREKGLRRISLTVQMDPSSNGNGNGNGVGPTQAAAYQDYVEDYFDEIDFKVYWGTAQDFSRELRQRWEKFDGS